MELPEDLSSALKAIGEAACFAAEVACYAADLRYCRLRRDYSNELVNDSRDLEAAATEAERLVVPLHGELIAAHQDPSTKRRLKYQGVSSSACMAALHYIRLIRDGARIASAEINELMWDEPLVGEIVIRYLKIPAIDSARFADAMLAEAERAARRRGTEEIVAGPVLPPRAIRAQQQYIAAMKDANDHNVSLTTYRDVPTDQAAYDYYKEHVAEEAIDMPAFDTWAHSLRTYRHMTNTSKYGRRAGRTGRSVIPQKDA